MVAAMANLYKKRDAEKNYYVSVRISQTKAFHKMIYLSFIII